MTGENMLKIPGMWFVNLVADIVFHAYLLKMERDWSRPSIGNNCDVLQ
jgi:hypothetical protein